MSDQQSNNGHGEVAEVTKPRVQAALLGTTHVICDHGSRKFAVSGSALSDHTDVIATVINVVLAYGAFLDQLEACFSNKLAHCIRSHEAKALPGFGSEGLKLTWNATCCSETRCGSKCVL
jgi:hypothetical protein